MTLSQTAILTRQIITISIFALVLGTVSFIGYKIWNAYYLANLPPVEEIPDTKFGLLPAIDFPQSSVSSSNFSYSIDTSTGNLPKVGQDTGFEKLVKVYFVTRTFATLLSGEKSQSLAEKFGIISQPEILSETNYLFREGDKVLNIDLDSGNFYFRNESTMSGVESLDDDNKLVADYQRTLKFLGVYKENLQNGRTKVVLLKDEGNTFLPTQLRTEAQAAQVSLWPSQIDNKPIFTPQFNASLINAVIYKSADTLENFLSLDFTDYSIDTSTFATYPLKSTDEALEDLKKGKGVVIIEPQKPQVSITSVYLGYYLAENYNPYLQPIFVFEGPSFVAYVGAISSAYSGVSE